MPDEVPPPFRISSWVQEPPPSGQRAAWHRLAAGIRAVNEALMDMDASEEDLEAAATALHQFAENLEKTRTGRQLWGFGESAPAGTTRAMLDRSPIVGLGNPVAPPLVFSVEGDQVVGRGSFGLQYEGPPNSVHGGFVAAALDELLGMAQSLSGKAGMTGTLTIRYRKPTPLHTDLTLTARVDRVEGRKIFTRGEVRAGEMLCAEAEGIFISVDFEAMFRMQNGG
ncbi:MAG TPA: PaaI family thioesterase [Tepidiformaceae bacterium]|nr:PaaI family thioesterase [Tepidiformaceae bacterium]HNO64935.1 PaaI family thioesterase [Tepidiformaceae bacterium]